MAVVASGALVVHVWGNKLLKHMKLLLAFGGAYLIGLVFLHLVPEVFQNPHADNHEGLYLLPGWFVIVGFLLQLILEYFSNGIEHGHHHEHKRKSTFPIMVFLSLCAHAFIEAMPLAGGVHHHGHDHGHVHIEGTSLLLGLMIHKFPVAMVLAGLLLTSSMSKLKQWVFLAIFALMPVSGMLLSDRLLHIEGLDAGALMAALSGVLIGILLHISTTMLFETSDGHRFNSKKLITVIFGLALAALTLT